VSGDPRPSGGLLGRIADRISEGDGAAALAGEAGETFSMLDMVGLPDDQAELARHVLRARQRPTVESAATDLGWSVDEVGRVLALLADRGALVVTDGEIRPGAWRVQRRPPDGLWSRLADL